MSKASGAFSAAGQTVVLDVREANSAAVHLVGGGVAATGIGLVFEATLDAVTPGDAASEAAAKWFRVEGTRTQGSTIEDAPTNIGLAIGAALTYAWKLNVTSYAAVRVRCSARTAGDVVATIIGTRFPTEPAPTVRGSMTANPPTGTKHRLKTAASTNLANLVNSPCNLDVLTISNPTATPAFLKLYDKATAPVIGTDVPELIVPIPANSFQAIPFPNTGHRFAAGLGHAVVAGGAEADATATVAGIIVSLTRH